MKFLLLIFTGIISNFNFIKHDAATANIHDGSGGPHATLRFSVGDYPGNAGLNVGIQLLAPIKAQYPGISYADLWAFAASVTVSNSGGPKIDFRPGKLSNFYTVE